MDGQNAPNVKVLLANGVSCDFEESDRPPPRHAHDNGCEFYDVSDPEGFMTLLVRAVKYGNIELARLCRGREPVSFSCGRVVQLAMELGQLEMVQLLLDSGADINLTQPVWDVAGHECDFASRAGYQRVTAGLRRLSR